MKTEISRTSFGFVENLDHPIIDKIEFMFEGICKISYRNGTTRLLDMESDIYNCQYGIPVSNDGAMLFRSDWEKGIYAISAKNGAVIWRFRQRKVRRIFVYQTYIIALKQGYSIIKLDLTTGEVLAELKSPSIEDDFQLCDSYILVDRIKGCLCILETEKMTVSKRYTKSSYNPTNCLSLVIGNAYYENGKLTISGFEEYPNKEYHCFSKKAFVRVLD